MNTLSKLIPLMAVSLLPGCAHLDFGPDRGLSYYDTKPYLFVTTTKDCVTTATAVMLPDEKREVKFVAGYGTGDLSVTLANGVITSVNQKTDAKIPETLTAVAGLATAVGGLMKAKAEPGKQVICTPTASLYSIDKGIPSSKPISFPVTKELVDVGG